MNKVYILSTEKGSWDDFESRIYAVFSNENSAKKEKARIEERMMKIKNFYQEKYNSSLEEDSESLDDEIITRYYRFRNDNPQVKVHTVTIQEFELWE